MIATDTAFPAARPLAVPWPDPHACALGPPGLRMSPGWDRTASGQLWVPSPRLGCPRHPSESPDADSSRGAVLRQNAQQLGKAFHLVNLLREAAEASSELTARPFQTCCFAPGGLFARSRRCHGSGVCWIRAAHGCQRPRCAGGGGGARWQCPETHLGLGSSAWSDPACAAWGHCGDVPICLAGELCPPLWDEDLVGNKYENVTGKESPPRPADGVPAQP